MDLNGQIAIVTGAGRGLGKAFALALAQAGAQVVVTARSEPELLETARAIEQQNGIALAIAADVTDRSAVERLAAQVARQFGPVDLLVNNAGAFRALGPLAVTDPDEWWREVEINLRGPQLYMRAVLPSMLERCRGRIINVASGAGLAAMEDVSAYAVSKAALIRLTENTAMETRSQGIAIFAINPGTVRTPMSDYVAESPEMAQRAPLVQQSFQKVYAENLDAPIEASVALVLQLASGQADALSGCFLSWTLSI